MLAIKQTLYRTSADSPIVRSLIRAAENGKQVTARRRAEGALRRGAQHPVGAHAEDAGVHVVYGLIGLKTHCKVALVVRREGNGIKRYVHLSTGNYNPSTARVYGDLSYFTARDAYADDAGALFNLLTGYSSPPSWKRFAIAPHGLQDRIIALIEREARARARAARIIAKMNALVDAPVIKALYRASQAGVSIDLIVRGICCLRPGVPGTSDNIRVISIVDRFLEHARIFHFGNGGKREVYLSSADWMPRNFQRRIEVMFPIEDEGLRDRVIDEILAIALKDNVKARQLMSDGRYVRRAPRRAAPTAKRPRPASAASTGSWNSRARRRRPGRLCREPAGPTTCVRRRRRGTPGRARRRGGYNHHAADVGIVVTAPTTLLTSTNVRNRPYHCPHASFACVSCSSLSALTVGIAASARASLVLALDLPAMVSRADHVAVVDVASVKADWDARHEQILTTIDLVVVESWKGGDAPASHMTIVQPGGTVGDLTQTIHGMTRFVPGERAVVFLSGRPDRRDRRRYGAGQAPRPA